MFFLSRDERTLIHSFLNFHLPNFIQEYSDDKFDLLDCYEIGFVFANNLLRNEMINPSLSPWGDGKSVIFDQDYSKLLLDIIDTNQDENVRKYCRLYIELLEVFKNHFIEQ